jgi:hypothetical protein
MNTTWLHDGLNDLLKRRGKQIILSEELYEWQRETVSSPVYKRAGLPSEARLYLKPDNPKLLELKRRYAAFHPEVTTPLVWEDGHLRDEDIPYFRGDNAYVWQVRGQNMNILGYALAFYYLKSIDRLGLLDQVKEDDAFGNFTFQIGGRPVSRDLLDSLVEICFLNRHLDFSNRSGFTILDIGAGYGRLAYRAATVWQGLETYFCTDAVPYSTFISEFYLRSREVQEKAVVVPLDELEQTLTTRKIDLAINIHSFSECRPAAINWWISLLANKRVKHVMIVPNATNCGGERLQTNECEDFTPILEKHGYSLKVKEPKYREDPVVQQFAITPTYHYLFELNKS